MCAIGPLCQRTTLLDLQDVTFSYPANLTEQRQGAHLKPYVFAPVTARIRRGEFTVVCGLSGSGKTTFLRALNPLLTLNGTLHGSILFNGRPLDEIPARELASQIAFVQQHSNEQLVCSDVRHELSFTLENLGYDHNFIARRVAEITQYFGITSWLNRRTTDLSGGEQQLLNVAAALICAPQLLILDEPTAQLDEISRARLLALLHRIHTELEMTIIIAEHALEELVPLADSVIYLEEEGESISESWETFTQRVLDHPSHPLLGNLPVACRAVHHARRQYLPRQLNTPSSLPLPYTIPMGREELRRLLADDIKAACLDTPAHLTQDTLHAVSPPHTYAPSSDLLTNREDPSKKQHVCACKRIALRYDRSAPCIFDDLSLELRQGEIHMLVGGNGSGKSTLIKAVMGIIKPLAGKIVRKKGCKIGLVPQQVRTMFSATSVAQEIASLGPHLTKQETDDMVNKVLEAADLTHRATIHPYDLSAGEMQRLGIELALINRPHLLLLDEPCKGLDSAHKQRIFDRLTALNNQGMTILIATHDLDMAARLGHRITLLTPHTEAITASTNEFLQGNAFFTTPCVRLTQNLTPTLPTCTTYEMLVPQIEALCRRQAHRLTTSTHHQTQLLECDDTPTSLNITNVSATYPKTQTPQIHTHRLYESQRVQATSHHLSETDKPGDMSS